MSSAKAKYFSSNPFLIFWRYCICSLISFISDSAIFSVDHLDVVSFLFSCKWLIPLSSIFLTCCKISQIRPESEVITCRKGDLLSKDENELSILPYFQPERLNPLSTEDYLWLIVKTMCKIMYSSLCMETPINSLKKNHSIFLCLA